MRHYDNHSTRDDREDREALRPSTFNAQTANEVYCREVMRQNSVQNRKRAAALAQADQAITAGQEARG
jgi:hypothetical protein